jgi:hypothetical protein
MLNCFKSRTLIKLILSQREEKKYRYRIQRDFFLVSHFFQRSKSKLRSDIKRESESEERGELADLHFGRRALCLLSASAPPVLLSAHPPPAQPPAKPVALSPYSSIPSAIP